MIIIWWIRINSLIVSQGGMRIFMWKVGLIKLNKTMIMIRFIALIESGILNLIRKVINLYVVFKFD